MTSKSFSGNLSTDSNVILAAAIGGAARRVFEQATDVFFVTPAVTFQEAKDRLPILARRYRIDPVEADEYLQVLPIVLYEEAGYASHIPQARKFLEKRDPSDIPVAALALKLTCPVWSNDRDFEVVPLIQYPTAKLLKLLGLDIER